MKVDRQISAQVWPDLDGFEGSVLVVPMTSVADGKEHAVADVEFGRANRRGQYQALCESPVLPGSLFDPPGRPCQACVARLGPKPMTTRAGVRMAVLDVREAARRVLGRTRTRAKFAKSRRAMRAL